MATSIPSLINPESSHHDATSFLVEDSVVDVRDEPQIDEDKNDNERSRAALDTSLPQVDEFVRGKKRGGVGLHDKSKLICCSVCRCVIAESMKLTNTGSARPEVLDRKWLKWASHLKVLKLQL